MNKCMFHPVGQPQKLLFPQQYSPVPIATFDHGLGHLASSLLQMSPHGLHPSLHCPLGYGSQFTDRWWLCWHSL